MAGCVDNLDFFKVSVQKLSLDGKNVTATAVVLLHGDGLRETRTCNWCITADEREEKKRHKREKNKSFDSIHMTKVHLIFMRKKYKTK